MTTKLELGDEVKCKVTGFTGIAICRTQYLNGCDRIGVQPPVDKDGKHPETYHIDDLQLEVVVKGKVKMPKPVWDNDGKPESAKRNTGGPSSNKIA